jgi:hypothetical protein
MSCRTFGDKAKVLQIIQDDGDASDDSPSGHERQADKSGADFWTASSKHK